MGAVESLQTHERCQVWQGCELVAGAVEYLHIHERCQTWQGCDRSAHVTLEAIFLYTTLSRIDMS